MPTKDVSKEVLYLNKDFVSLRNSLINFAKIYFPDSYNDFNESSLGMMFIEMSAYVGDVLSYYIDSTLKESFLNYAEEKNNIIYLAQGFGYKYKTTVPATTNLDVYQLLPPIGTNSSEIDFRFALKIDAGMTVQSENFPDVQFRTTEPIDFSIYDNGDFLATVYSIDTNTNLPSMYLVKKTVPAVAGNITSTNVTVTTTEQFTKITLPYSDIIEVLDVYDDNNNKWYEVDYLAQDTVLFDEENSYRYNSELYTGTGSLAPQRILKMKRVAKRYITRRNNDGQVELQFGAGISAYPDDVLIPNPTTVKYNNTFSSFTDLANSYLNTRTYGAVPLAGTVLTIRYTRGGGLQSNVQQSDLTKIKNAVYKNSSDDYTSPADKNMFTILQRSLAVTNPEPATGGKGGETLEEIRQNAMAYFTAQDRTVTDSDYLVRTLSMPAKYGNITKVSIEKDAGNFAINIYTLGYDSKNKLVVLNNAIKQNLVTYLKHYRDLTTAINIKDAFVINIGIKFNMIAISKYNKNDVLLRCIREIQNFFNIDNWQIGQPIILRDLYERLDKLEGVRTVSNVEIYNKYDPTLGYSNNFYNIASATVDGIIYPSADPSIFELKYPNIDIEGLAR